MFHSRYKLVFCGSKEKGSDVNSLKYMRNNIYILIENLPFRKLPYLKM